MSKKLTRRVFFKQAMAAGAGGFAARATAMSGLTVPAVIGRAHASDRTLQPGDAL